jgi:hypothetical protein
MGTGKPLPELFQQTRKTLGEEVFYCFDNDSQIKAAIGSKSVPGRILGLATPHGSMMCIPSAESGQNDDLI